MMEVFEVNTKSKLIKNIRKALLISGVIAVVYLLVQAFNEFLENKKSSTFRK